MKRFEIIACIALIACFFVFSSQFTGFLQDDAYIFARYAQNIADGNGFVYNKGEHVEGATSLLWTLMAAGGATFGADVPQFLKIASLLSSFLWLVAFALVCRQWMKESMIWVLPVFLFSCFSSFVLWSQAGLEVNFFGFLVMSGFFLAEEWRRKGKRIYFGLLCLCSFLLILTRPEAPAVIFLYAVYLLFYPRLGRRQVLFTAYLPVVIVTFVALLAFRYTYFHDFVPNTYYAKGGGGYYLWRLGLGKLNVFLQTNFTLVFFALSVPILLINSPIRVLIAIVPIWVIYFIKSGGDILPEHRLFLPAVPFLFLGSFYVLYSLQSNYFEEGTRKIIYNSGIALGSIVFIGFYVYYYQTSLAAYSQVIPALERAHGDIGRYLEENMDEDDSAILTDAGITAMYAKNKRMVDWLGLCDKRVARIFYKTGYNEWAMSYCYDDKERNQRKKACFDAMNTYFDELQPRYAVLNLYIENTSEKAVEMAEFAQNLPDTLPDFVLNQISFHGYFGVFTKANKGRGYKPVLAKAYNPYFWMIVAERPNK